MTMQSDNKEGRGLSITSMNSRRQLLSGELGLADELVGLRRFLERLESPKTALFRNQVDVTESEISILKREIADLERVFANIR